MSLSRRKFLGSAAALTAGTTAFGMALIESCSAKSSLGRSAVSIVKIKDGDVYAAVNEAISLLGGIRKLTEGQNRILLKPNLVAPDPAYTTKPEVVKAVARIMLAAGKELVIGEGSAAADNFNFIDNQQFITKKKEILDPMQQYVFDTLGYTEMAAELGIPLINLHSGEIEEVKLNRGYAADSVKIHRKLTEADLVCSIPMMKTHVLATVSLAMKNLIGLYPGSEYYAMRSRLHDSALEKGSEGVSFEVLDMNNAVKTGLCIIDAGTAMEGNGPTAGTLVDMGLIIAGTNPLAADMIATEIMGFDYREIPTFRLAHKAGMKPSDLQDIEQLGVPVSEVKREFVRPEIVQWGDFGYKVL